MVSPDPHAAPATQRLARLGRTTRPGHTAGATNPGRRSLRPSSADVRGLVDELRGYWDRRAAGRQPAAA
jgi:hypothetical protein